MVSDERGHTFGALRRFADRRERADALALLGIAGPAGPALLDVVDASESPASIVTAWAPGRSAVRLDHLAEPDDLLAQVRAGQRWTPAEALRLLVPLGEALDRFADRGFVPLELSPDHLVENGGNVRLVGWSRHIYQPRKAQLPDSSGMSLPTTQLLCGEMPGPDADFVRWRWAQVQMLLRLAGWMCSGLPPGSWGVVAGGGQDGYLRASSFAHVPVLTPGRLAQSLADATRAERSAEAVQRVRRAACVVLYDEAALQGSSETREQWQQTLVGELLAATVIEVASDRIRVDLATEGNDNWQFNIFWRDTPEGGSRDFGYVDLTRSYREGDSVCITLASARPISARVVEGSGARARARRKDAGVRINPEALRLGLLDEHGPDVIAVAALPVSRRASPMAALLSGAGWLMIEADRFPDVLRTLRREAPTARVVVAGRPGGQLSTALPSGHDEVLPGQSRGPRVAGRYAAALPYLDDPDLSTYSTEVLHGHGGMAFRRQTFAAGWALALDEDAFENKQSLAARDSGRQLRNELDDLNALYGSDTELLLRVAQMRGRPGLRSEATNQMRARLREAAPVLRGMPPSGALRNDLTHALLSRSIDNVHSDVTRWLLPVAPKLAQVYEPQLQLGGKGLDDLLYTREGVRKLGLLGRLATAVPSYPVQPLLDAVARLDQALVNALLDVPAPSLQFLVGRLGSTELFSALRPFIEGPDLDLLGQYTPRAWQMLLEGLRQPEYLAALGLGWTLVVERDPTGAVDARVLQEIARQAQVPARYVVRALLESPVGQWRRLLQAPTVAAVWLQVFGRLDAGPVLDAFPNAAELLHQFSPQALRAAALAGLDTDLLATLEGFARGVGLSAGNVVTAFLNIGAEAADARVLASPAAATWIADQIADDVSLENAMADLIEQPGLLRTWLINGKKLGSRVLAAALGSDPRSLGIEQAEGIRLLSLLEAQPALLSLLRTLTFPSQRIRLLRLALAHPQWSLACEPVRDALPTLLDRPDHEKILEFMLGEQLSYPQARFALESRLDKPSCILLRVLGPLPPSDDLIAVAASDGIAVARDTAILEQARPGAAMVIRSWGSRWLPLLAGPVGTQITGLLAGLNSPSPAVSAWLRAAGHDGLIELGRHGQALLTLVQQCNPPPEDAKLLGNLLQLGGNAAAYRLIVKHGVPHHCWRDVVVRSSEPAEDILLSLWSSDGWPAATASTHGH